MKFGFLICRLYDSLTSRWQHFVYMEYQKSKMASVGTNVEIGNKCSFVGENNISIGNDVYIGPDVMIMTTEAKVKIGNKVMLGPQVAIITGNHRSDVIGKYMTDVTDKLPENDQDVLIHDDVWIGMRAMIFKGVEIGEGSIVAGGGSCYQIDSTIYSVYFGCKTVRSIFKRRSRTA